MHHSFVIRTSSSLTRAGSLRRTILLRRKCCGAYDALKLQITFTHPAHADQAATACAAGNSLTTLVPVMVTTPRGSGRLVDCFMVCQASRKEQEIVAFRFRSRT